MIDKMPCITDLGQQDEDPFSGWLEWVMEDLSEDDYNISPDRLAELAKPYYDHGLTAGTTALKIAELLDMEEVES